MRHSSKCRVRGNLPKVTFLENNDPERRMQNLRLLVQGLPTHNRDLLVYLIKFLNKLSQQSAVNKMTSSNLATCWAPNLLKAGTWDMSMLTPQRTSQFKSWYSILFTSILLWKHWSTTSISCQLKRRKQIDPTASVLQAVPRYQFQEIFSIS